MMIGSASIPTHAALLYLVLIFVTASFKLCYCMRNSSIFCPEIEKQSLLTFKESLSDPNHRLSSWDGAEVNCCKWKGVVCNNSTSHVTELHLFMNYNLSGKINPSIGNLSHLQTLVFNDDGLSVDNLDWLSSLTKLEYLDMNNVNLQKVDNLAKVINSLPSLIELSLSGCSLDPLMAPLDDVNVTSLTFLDISLNQIDSLPFLSWIFQLNELLFLEFFINQMGGAIPTITNATKLQHIDLSGNNFNSSVPDSLYLCRDLEFVDLRNNQLQGTVSNAIANLASLSTLKLSGNKLTGNLPESLGELYNLQFLDISDNKLKGVVSEASFKNLTNLKQFQASGNHLSLKVSPHWIPPFQLDILQLGSWDLGAGAPIPSWLDTQKLSISDLDLSNTGISGSVPEWIWGIISLNLSHNHLHGQIPSLHGYRASLSSNLFNGSLPRITDSFEMLDLSNNSLSGGLSDFFCDNTYNYYQLYVVHLGKNQLSGSLPGECMNKWINLWFLNIGDNNMSGSIPSSIGFLTSLISLNLYGNKFSGPIPLFSSSLQKIDLACNDLDGSMPTWIRELGDLRMLSLQSNKFDGQIPPEICRLNNLQILDLSGNNFSGIIPACVHNLTAMATKRSLPFDSDDDSYRWVKESASVTSKGIIMQYGSILALVTNIDLSNNNLSGEIPKGFTSLVELKSLNLSLNHLTGTIPENIGDMKQLESLDFSDNSLSGPIPSSLALVNFLSYLNVSYNRLTGRIPQGTQLQIMDASAYIGNDLCGPPLTSNCSRNIGDEIPNGGKEEDEEGRNKIEWIYVLMSLGYAVGFSAVCTALALSKSWRVAYFGFLEEIWDKLSVYVRVKWSRIVKPSTSTS